MPKTIIFSPQKCYPASKAAHYFDDLKLVPGSKVYSDDEVQLLVTHPDYPRYREWGAIAILEPKTEIEVQPEQPGNSLSTYNVDDAEQIIMACHDVAQLEAWLKDDKRVTVRQLLNRRIKAIKEGAE